MFELDDSMLLGRGQHRACYRHPEDSNKCIKVLYKVSEKELRTIKMEIKYYEHLNTYLKDWSRIPKYEGVVETNLGQGQVFACVVNADGTPSEILTNYARKITKKEDAEEVMKMVRELHQYILDNHIVTYPLHGHNLLVQIDEDGFKRLVICDNIGQRQFFQLAVWFKWVATLRHQQQYRKFLQDDYMQDLMKKFSVHP